ncbi:MAG: polymer-forming cytoskeletal protein [candidate division KSB1 bacterium]|nr:polymer-forming cytoskeletal protein [candidate division KSB1 bacterium]MDZ7346303.1 polymer-forming cytoskeletal protein [candidate division KSB1 bacterium]
MKNETKPGDLSTILGKGSEFEGKIKVGHTMRVDGKVVGDIITTDMLIVGKDGYIQGNISAKNLVVGGKINGTAEVKEKIVLESNAEFHGDMKTSRLVIDEGAIFDGRCSMKEGAPAKPKEA